MTLISVHYYFTFSPLTQWYKCLSAHPHTLPTAPTTVLLLLCILLGFQRAVSCTGVTSAILTPLPWPGWIQLCAVCLLRTAAEFVCGRLSERPARCDERHLDLPIHFTFAPINYSTGQPIKNEGERSGPRPPKAATRQLSPWIIGAINLALSNKGVLTLLSPSVSLSLSLYTAEPQHTSHYRHTSQQHTHCSSNNSRTFVDCCITYRDVGEAEASYCNLPSFLLKAIVCPLLECNKSLHNHF